MDVSIISLPNRNNSKPPTELNTIFESTDNAYSLKSFNMHSDLRVCFLLFLTTFSCTYAQQTTAPIEVSGNGHGSNHSSSLAWILVVAVPIAFVACVTVTILGYFLIKEKRKKWAAIYKEKFMELGQTNPQQQPLPVQQVAVIPVPPPDPQQLAEQQQAEAEALQQQEREEEEKARAEAEAQEKLTKAKYVPIKRDKCYICGQAVYEQEKVSVSESKNFHRGCFKCSFEGCSITLNLRNYFVRDDKLLCGAHFRQTKQTNNNNNNETVVVLTEEERVVMKQKQEEEKVQVVRGMAAVLQSIKMWGEEAGPSHSDEDLGLDPNELDLEEREQLREREREREQRIEEEMERKRRTITKREGEEGEEEEVTPLPIGRLNITQWEKQNAEKIQPLLRPLMKKKSLLSFEIQKTYDSFRTVSQRRLANIRASNSADKLNTEQSSEQQQQQTGSSHGVVVIDLAEQEMEREKERQKELEMEARLKQKREMLNNSTDNDAADGVGKLDIASFELLHSQPKREEVQVGKINAADWEQRLKANRENNEQEETNATNNEVDNPVDVVVESQ